MTALTFPPRTKLARLMKQKEAWVERQAVIELRLAELPVLELQARADALRRDPGRPAVDDQLVVAVEAERLDLERELAEIGSNIAASDVVAGEEQAVIDAERSAQLEADFADAQRKAEEAALATIARFNALYKAFVEQAQAYTLAVAAWKLLGTAGEGRQVFPTSWAAGDFPRLFQQLLDATVRRGDVDMRDPFLLEHTRPLPDVRLSGHGALDIRVSSRQPGIEASGVEASGFGVAFRDI